MHLGLNATLTADVAIAAFQEAHPGTGILQHQGRISRIYGEAFQLTGDQSYLDRAHEALVWMLEHAWDAANGGRDPYGVDNGWVGGLGETRPTPPSS